jgi:hypothetical protein
MRLTDTQIAAGIAAVRQYVARSRKSWTLEEWRAYERARKAHYRARQRAIGHLLSTPVGAFRLLEAMAMAEEEAAMGTPPR